MAMAFTFQVLENGPRNLVLAINGVDAASTTAGVVAVPPAAKAGSASLLLRRVQGRQHVR